MSLLSLMLVLVIVGLILWLINTYVPMAPPIRTTLNAIVVILVIVWALQELGLLTALNSVKVK